MEIKEKIEKQLKEKENQFMRVFEKYDSASGEEREKYRHELEIAESHVRRLEIALKNIWGIRNSYSSLQKYSIDIF